MCLKRIMYACVCVYVSVLCKVKELFKLLSDKSISIFMSFVLLIINNVLIERAAVCSDGRVETESNMAVCADSPYGRQHNTHPCLQACTCPHIHTPDSGTKSCNKICLYDLHSVSCLLSVHLQPCAGLSISLCALFSNRRA